MLSKFFNKVIKWFVKLWRSFKKFWVQLFKYFKDGNIFVKLSFLIMGFGLLVGKKVIKGLLYLGTEVLFIFLMIQIGIPNLKQFFSLGSEPTVVVGQDCTEVIPGLTQCEDITQIKDYSVLILLLSVFSIILIIGFIILYISSIKSSYNAQKEKEMFIKDNAFKSTLSKEELQVHNTKTKNELKENLQSLKYQWNIKLREINQDFEKIFHNLNLEKEAELNILDSNKIEIKKIVRKYRLKISNISLEKKELIKETNYYYSTKIEEIRLKITPDILKDLKLESKELYTDIVDKKYAQTLLAFPTIGVLIFTIVPLLYMILIAFTNFDREHQPPAHLFDWVGLKSLGDVLTGNYAVAFWQVLGWTLIWAFFATFLNYFLGLGLAILINRKGTKFKKVFRTIFITTIAIPQFVSLLLINQMLQDRGLVNNILYQLLKTNSPIVVKFLSDGTIAKITVIIVNIWIGVPYTMLITSGLLMNIPADLYESADIDGASGFKKFVHITMPYILFATGPYLITQFVGNINNFNVIFLLTGGGPKTSGALTNAQAGQTDLLITWLFNLSVNNNNYNTAAAIGLLLFIVTGSISLIVYNKSSSVKKEGAF
jgi:ABC-type sugar transport system permease subunit